MRITDYGKTIADRPAETASTGATAHMEACRKDDGLTIVLTGHDVHGKRLRREVGSLSAAYFTMHAMWGIERAWHVREDGSRRLAIARY